MSPLPLLGTAGHVDHGKTALVRALTGVDTDRLPEEKARGITTDLGFATIPGVAAVIDVPGHERFVRTMLAGATGLDLVVLVIAADEGPMPQTREHLDICRLLDVPRGLVALTKVDRVEPDWLALVSEEIRRTLAGSFLEGAPLVPVSSVTGAGLPALRAEIERLAKEAQARPAGGPVRLPLDRVFTLKGFGTVVTGTLASGRLRVGETLGAAGVVRSLEVHGQAREEAVAGERVAVNLPGVTRESLGRGDVLVRAGEMEASAVIDVSLTVLPLLPRPLPARAKVLFHALTAQENALVIPLEGAQLSPGARSLAQIHLARPLPLLPGDRFVLRGFEVLPGYGTTVGGGRVLRVQAPRRRRADETAAAQLRRMAEASLDERVALEIAALGRRGVDRAGLFARLGESPARLEQALGKILSAGAAVTFHREAGGVVDRVALDALAARATELLDELHAREPLMPGMPREELRGALGRPILDARLYARLLAGLVEAGAVAVDGDLVRRAQWAPRGESDAVARVRSLMSAAGLAPPWTAEIAAAAGVTASEARAALELLGRSGELVRVRADLHFHRDAIDALRARLRAHLQAHGQITAQEWKALTGQTRKYAIPLAEHFDGEKVTLRVGEIRRLR